ncbi:DUF1376 domain-containing protein [candidate division KSB1 bacterium]|nr:DUF1376 domain-containing protein [candidate division KSB1 bacterium]
MSRPWMPLYVGDYLADTGHLRAIEHGAYLLLIMHYWQKGSLPNDDRRLASIARVSPKEWAGMRKTILSFFDDDEGWVHSRIEAELKKSKEAYEKRAISGKKGGLAKATNAKSLLEQNPSNGVAVTSLKSRVLNIDPTLLPYIDTEINQLPVSEKPACEKLVKKTRKLTEYPLDFCEFWKEYPTDANMSKLEAFGVWKHLSPVDRQGATRSLPSFRAYCAGKPEYRPIHANRYLSQRRFDGHLEAAATRPRKVYVKRDTPQWHAWRVYHTKEHGSVPPSDRHGGWYFPSEYPPGTHAGFEKIPRARGDP